MVTSGKPDPTKDTVTPDGVYTRYTIGITAAYLFIVAIAFFGGHIGKSTDMNPNEWGDLDAGRSLQQLANNAALRKRSWHSTVSVLLAGER